VTVSKTFGKIIKSAESQKHKSPNLLCIDKSLEFENRHFKPLLNNFNIKMYHEENEEKSAIIERCNRTLNSKMRIQFEAKNNKKWTDILQDLLDEYNFNYKHSSTGMTPSDVNKSNENLVLRTLFKQSDKERKPKINFKVGDRVRIKIFKKLLVKNMILTGPENFFKEILNTQPVTYKIKDLNDEEIIGTFYNEELKKLNFNYYRIR
jgi:hypothetical protein